MSDTFFKIIWKQKLGDISTNYCSPVLINKVLFVRYSGSIYAFGDKAGQLIWEKRLPAKADSKMFDNELGLIITEYTPDVGNDNSIIMALDIKGEEHWSLNFDSRVMPKNYCKLGGKLYVTNQAFRQPQPLPPHIWVIDILTGKLEDVMNFSMPISRILPFKQNKLIGANYFMDGQSEPGLFSIDIKTKQIEVLSYEPTYQIIVAGEEQIIYSIEKEDHFEIIILNHTTGESFFRQKSEQDSILYKGKQIAYFQLIKGAYFLEKKEISTGKVLWRIACPGNELASVYLENHIVMLKNTDGTYFYDWVTGKSLRGTEDFSFGPPLVVGNSIYLLDNKEIVKAQL